MANETKIEKRDVSGRPGLTCVEYGAYEAGFSGSVATLRAENMRVFGERKNEVTINWAGCGSKTIEATEAFIAVLQAAVADAKEALAKLEGE